MWHGLLLTPPLSPLTAIAHDYNTDAYYWAIVGGQANIYEVIGAVAGSTPSPRYTRRDQPFALDVDWVSKRLFWIEDGEGVSEYHFEGFDDFLCVCVCLVKINHHRLSHVYPLLQRTPLYLIGTPHEGTGGAYLNWYIYIYSTYYTRQSGIRRV